MIIAARAIGSHLGFVYIRGEYVQPWRVFSGAVKEAYAAGLLGKNIQGSGFDFDIVIHRGAGAYICGEETGLLSSLEGKKGWPKIKPPFPAVKGAFGAARPSSTTSRRSRRCPTSSTAAPSGSPGSAPRPRAARGSTRCPATW